ncbi:uncharacterized protein ARMOST_21698 [Armillaria ostoyae]|uniref:Uncharacterized protein n=1 Tax=Armillaria ostoyae TaxID=47428 RepID=A0A284SAY7_ARMOS|nr:uncharacterized protein ARMOST_21698 [Armillaria ostoyae]
MLCLQPRHGWTAREEFGDYDVAIPEVDNDPPEDKDGTDIAPYGSCILISFVNPMFPASNPVKQVGLR